MLSRFDELEEAAVIYRNSLLADHVTWTPDNAPEASAVARAFLQSECELLRLARIAPEALAEMEAFLRLTENMEIRVARSGAGELLIDAAGTHDHLLITGKTAAVLRSYIDEVPVRMEDRGEMTLHRQLRLSA